jgi:hypothetical protein
MIYEHLTGAKLDFFGCIVHSEYGFIGASPDGIVVNPESALFGRLVEIKNIYNREMDGTPSEAYWTQMQIQMQCCDLEACDFVETRFKEYESAEEFWAPRGQSPCGRPHFDYSTVKSERPMSGHSRSAVFCQNSLTR